MAFLERRKGSFRTALPERLPEVSEVTVESPKNHKGTGSPTSWSGAFRAAENALCWARTEGAEGQAVGGSQFAISLGFLSSTDAAPGVTGARNASLMCCPCV